MTADYNAWKSDQQQRRFYISFANPTVFKEPLFDVQLSNVQKKDGFVGYWPEYPVDAEKKTWRVSPIFVDVKAAVGWLTKAASSWRSPFLGKVNLYEPEYGSSDTHDGEIVFELADRYGGHVYAQDIASSPLSTVLFRGQRDARHGLIPALYRVFQDSSIDYAEAERRFKDEIKKTKRFTEEFFVDPEMLGVMHSLEGPDLSKLGIPSRAAIARHYGYHSQFIDFSADVGVAGFFASMGEVPTSKIGSIWYFDEAYVERGFSGKAVTRTPRYEHRFIYQESVDELRSRLIDVEAAVKFNWAGPLDAWDEVSKFETVQPGMSQWLPGIVLTPVQFSISLYFAPGPTIPRMNAQAWCALEMNTHLGWNKGNPRQISALHVILERLAGRVNFLHRGETYTRKRRNGLAVPPIFRHEISEKVIYPKGDLVAQAVEQYQNKTGLKPICSMSTWANYLQTEIGALRRKAKDGKRVKIALIGQEYVPSTRRQFTNLEEVIGTFNEHGLVEESQEARRLPEIISSIAPLATVEFENVVDPESGRAVDADIMAGMVAAKQKGADIAVLLLDFSECGEDCPICRVAHSLAASGVIIVCGPGPCPRPHPGVIAVAPLVMDNNRVGIYSASGSAGRRAKLAALAQTDLETGILIGAANVAGVIALTLSAKRGWWKKTCVSSVQLEEELRAACAPFFVPDGDWHIEYGWLHPSKLLE